MPRNSPFRLRGSLPNSSELIPGKRSGTLSRRLTHRHFHNLLQSAAETQPPLIAFGTTTPSRSLAAGPLAVSARSHWVRRCRPTFLHCEGDETNLSVANSVTEFPGFRRDMEIPECVSLLLRYFIFVLIPILYCFRPLLSAANWALRIIAHRVRSKS
jgi:hypothetical protein